MLSPAQLAARENKLTASRVGCLMRGDEVEILDLWKMMVGDPSYQEPDLSGVWAVQLGSHTESLSLDWFERKHGPVSRRGEVVIRDWAACTLDGWSDQHECPVETKHTGGREGLDVIIDRYQPQMAWQMLITDASQCALSVIMGANEPIVEFIERDYAYGAELMKRAEAFMQHVWNLTPPVALPPVAAPVRAERVYDMAGNNTWSSNAATWLSTRQAAKDCAAAEKEIKSIVPADAARCFGYGVEVKRNRAGHLSLKEKAS